MRARPEQVPLVARGAVGGDLTQLRLSQLGSPRHDIHGFQVIDGEAVQPRQQSIPAAGNMTARPDGIAAAGGQGLVESLRKSPSPLRLCVCGDVPRDSAGRVPARGHAMGMVMATTNSPAA